MVRDGVRGRFDEGVRGGVKVREVVKVRVNEMERGSVVGEEGLFLRRFTLKYFKIHSLKNSCKGVRVSG
jgi:hypothetical protein